MLSQSCPDCYAPLMRNKNKEVSCVVCNIPYLIGEDNRVYVIHLIILILIYSLS